MGCSGCSSGSDGAPAGCGNQGSCSTGGCNKLNTYDWLSQIDLPDYGNYDLVEVSFKNGARKEIFKKPEFIYLATGDHVAVESTANGYDIGQISLMGELVQLQLKKYRIKDNAVLPNILRAANERDMERLGEARLAERDAMIQARAIVHNLKLDMKIGDVEYQGDKRKITFYYTAEGRVDFRELIRIFAKEYKVKIEMRQIGARQESARIGGIGSCGRELCCSTWLTEFKSVSTVAARYQNLAINQSKLSGQCGRLKCCLNYELNTYLEVLQEFPKNVNNLKTKKGSAILIKTDIFKRLMFFAYRGEFGISEIHQLSTVQVKEIHAMNQKGIFPDDLKTYSILNVVAKAEEEKDMGFVDGAGSLELKQLDNKKKKRNKSRKNKTGNTAANTTENKTSEVSTNSEKSPGNKVREKRPANKTTRKPANSKPTDSSTSAITNDKTLQDKVQTDHTDELANKPVVKKKRPNRKKPNPNKNANLEQKNTSAKPETDKPVDTNKPLANDKPNAVAKPKNNRNRNRNKNKNKNKNSDSKPTDTNTNSNDNNT